MTRRRCWFLLALASLLCVPVCWLLLLWSQPRISPDNAKRIRKGMTCERVRAILGPPHEATMVWKDDRGFYLHTTQRPAGDGQLLPLDTWHGENCTINVVYVGQGRVAQVWTMHHTNQPPSRWDRLKSWFGM